MSERHITPELYHLAGSGVVSPRTLARMVHEHVLHHCPECRAAWQALGGDRRALALLLETDPNPGGDTLPPPCGTAAPATAPLPDTGAACPPHREARPARSGGRPAEAGSYTTAFGRVADRLERQVAELKRVRRQAREDLRELVALAPAARLRRIVNSRTRFRSRALAELLLEESRERVRNDPRLAAELAELVPHVLLWTPGAVEQDWARELDLLARARRGNALRVAGDLHAADRGFAALHQRTDCPLPPETAAELASLEASLRLDQRRFDDADALLDKAARLFRKAGVEEGLARVLVQRGILHRHAGRLPEAGRALDEAMQLLDPEHQTHLFLCAAGTLVLCLCESGELTAAHRMLRAQSALFEKVMDDWWALRLRVIEGRVLLALGDSSAAVRRFAEAREGYLARGAFLDAAVTCLDLALAYLALGQTTELKQLAAESAPVFRSVALQREALAAVRLFQQAAAAEHLTAAAVCHLRDVLEHARGQTPPAS